ncbi:hypothetical protein JMG10_45855, partial [Nostoc ellipsosporum NOK]|nr:hypothetical protein [Nostoc ellipsosporum NOK]
MSVPSSPGSADLAKAMNVVGKNIKTSKFKFANWNVKMGKYDTKLPDKAFKDLSRAARFYREGYYTPQQIKEIQNKAKEAADKAKEVTKEVGKVKKTVDKIKKPFDKFLEKIPGKNNEQKASTAGSTIGGLLLILGLTVFVTAKQFADAWLQDRQIETDDYLRNEIQKNFNNYIKNATDIKSIQKRTKDLELENQRVRDRVYSIEKQQPTIRDNIAAARKIANDTLYEYRIKFKEITKQQNDITYEVRAGRTTLEQKIASIQTKVNQALSTIGQGFQQQINTTIANIQKGLQQAQADNKKLTSDIAALQKSKNTKIVENLPTIIEKTFAANQLTLKAVVEKIVNPIAKIEERWGVTVTPATVTSATVTIADSGGVTVTPATVTPATVRYADFSSSDIGQQVKKIAAVGDEASNKNISTVSSAVGNLSGAISAVAQEAKEAKKVAFEALASKNFDPRVDFLTTKIKEVEKVNEEGNKKLGIIDSKLDKIIPTVAGIPIIVGKANDIINKMPTPGDIEKAAATGVCRSTQPGGCMNRALNDQSNNINNN